MMRASRGIRCGIPFRIGYATPSSSQISSSASSSRRRGALDMGQTRVSRSHGGNRSSRNKKELQCLAGREKRGRSNRAEHRESIFGISRLRNFDMASLSDLVGAEQLKILKAEFDKVRRSGCGLGMMSLQESSRRSRSPSTDCLSHASLFSQVHWRAVTRYSPADPISCFFSSRAGKWRLL